MTRENQLPLTPLEEAAAKERAQEAFAREHRLLSPEPERIAPGETSKRIMRALFSALSALLSSVPFWVLIIVIAAGVISADKTLKAFQDAAAHGDWSGAVGWAGVAMAEVGLVYLAFASRADRLNRGDQRRVVTLLGLLRGVLVRIGVKPPLPYSELPDTARGVLTGVLFALALAGNLYGVAFSEASQLEIAQTGNIAEFFTALVGLPFAQSGPVLLKIFLGCVAPLTLLVAGEELARVAFETRQRYERDFLAEERARWMAEMRASYEQFRAQREAEAMAKAYRAKNDLPLTAGTPYLLVAGPPTAEGETAPVAVPLATSQTPSLQPPVSTPSA